MINNRQSGRRRGRGGGGQARNMSPGAGNRQDNRQRGNAAQLLEKYKGLARDAQMQGDRVQTETYLQFADHYYRVLNESRARFEEQRRQRGESGYDGPEDEDDQEEMESARDTRDRDDSDYGESQNEPENAPENAEHTRRTGNGEERPRRPRPRRFEEPRSDERIAADILPPAISTSDDETAERAPRRRPRRPRDPDEDVAPAA